MVIGLERGHVELVPYDPAWRRCYETERARLQAAIGNHVLDIQHVGSTSIPGMIAKPIIDIAVAVASFETAQVCIAPVERLGYAYRGENGIPRRHFFVRGERRTHHLHINELNSAQWRNQVCFRDALIHNPELAAAYATLKQDLARQFPTDREAYTAGKAPFIRRVLAQAMIARWCKESGEPTD